MFFSRSNKNKIPKNIETTNKNIFSNSENYALVFQNLRIAVSTACISTENTEVIINPANTSLTHTTGVSAAIINKGGKSLSEQCNKVISQYGKIEPGNAFATDAGDLYCKSVFHCVGPSIFQNTELAEYQLNSAIYKALQLCDKFKYKSISIPIMSYGNMVAFSKEKSSQIIFNSIIEYIQNCSTQIRHIRFTNLDKSISEVFVQLLQKFQKQYIEVLTQSMTINTTLIQPAYRISIDSSNSGNSSARNSYEL